MNLTGNCFQTFEGHISAVSAPIFANAFFQGTIDQCNRASKNEIIASNDLQRRLKDDDAKNS